MTLCALVAIYYLMSNVSSWIIKYCHSFNARSEKIDHFRITFGLFFKASLGAHPFIWKLVFIHMQIEIINFHMKRWVPGLALKKRPKVIWKWSIKVHFSKSCWSLHLGLIFYKKKLMRPDKILDVLWTERRMEQLFMELE